MKHSLLLFLVICCASLTAQTNFQTKETRTTPHPKRSEMIGFTPLAIRLLRQNQELQIRPVQRIKNSNIKEGYAEVILEVHDIWGTGSIGYQMLLDADHNTYGDLYDASTILYANNNYDAFEFKLPTDAEAKENTKTTIINGEEKIEVPAGIYDFLVTCPIYGEGIIIPSGPFSRFDEFKFESGYTYRFKVELEQVEYGNIDVVNLYAEIDAAVTNLVLPPNSMDLTVSEPIGITIKNNSIDAISNFPVSYAINGGKAVTENYTGTIQSGESADYTFTGKADFSATQSYVVKANISLDNDLVPYNDAIEKTCRHIGVASLPFTENFATADNFLSEWNIVNKNDDHNTWQYNDWMESPDGSMGTVSCPTWSDDNDDYLITPPIHLDKGANHIIFYVKGISASEELLDVRYGKSLQEADMEIIGDFSFKDTEFRLKVINFDAAESGTYYFAFHAKSVAGSNLFLDDITIDAGTYAVSPELLIDKILAPYSNCDLSDQSPIGVRLSNKGTGPASTFTLSYSVNGGTAVTQTFSDVLPEGETKDFYLDTPANLLDIGSYSIKVISTCDTQTDTKTTVVNHYAPITELPAVTDFYLGTDIEKQWTLITPGSWSYDPFGGCYSTNLNGVENGLLSHCFTLNHGFRIKIAYTGGLFSTPSSFYIAYGKPGTDFTTWEKIYEDKEVSGDKEIEFACKPRTAGDYSFLIVNTTTEQNIAMRLYQFTLSDILDYDLRALVADAPLANYMPANHLKNEGEYTVNIVNRGSKTMTGIKAYVNNGDTPIFSSTEATDMESDATKELKLKGSLEALIAKGKFNLNLTVKGNETDLYPGDNMLPLPDVHLTDTVFATEQLEEFVYGTGQNGTPCSFGNVYTLTETDTLTSVTIGLCKDDYYSVPIDMGVAVYSLKEDGMTLDKELFSTQFERGAGGDLRKISFVPRILAPGKYFIEVQQLAYSNLGLAYDLVENTCFYQNLEGKLILISGFGNIVARANFGHRAKTYRKNAGATAITTPTHSRALFSPEETVTANIENFGSEAIENMEVRCSANGVEKSLKISLEPYEKQTVKFEQVDLSTPGEYALKVYTLLKEDENNGDDACIRNITSLEEANPYSLDFESCNDFDTDHQFNPKWWTIDRLGYEVDGWWQFDYPNNSKPVGFMAFNISATVPAMTDELNVPGFYPHSGERFGAAFATTQPDTDSDTWLISPKLKLSTNSSFELYVKTYSMENSNMEQERYSLLISDTDDRFESFKTLGEERRAPVEWTLETADLSAYDNKEVYVAIRYISKPFQGVVMMVDDIRVKSDGTGIRDFPEESDVQLSVDTNEKMLAIRANSLINRIELYEVSGQKVYQSATLNTESYRLSLDTYEPGVYIAYIHTAAGVKISKFILAR